MAGTFGNSFKTPSKIEVASEDTVVVGTDDVTPSDITGSDLDTALTNVADITSVAEEDWDDLLSISGTGGIQSREVTNIFSITVDIVETAANALRAQIVVDGVVIADAYVIRDAGDNHTASFKYLGSGKDGPAALFSIPIYFNSSFVIRAVRKGAFVDAGSEVSFNKMRYVEF